MPTLTVNGQRVTVGDEFLQLSPEEQEATVEEIAASMTPPDTSTSFGMGMGNAMMFGQAPRVAGALNYAKELGAEGAYDRGYEENERRQAQAWQEHPIASGLGTAAGVGAGMVGAPAAVAPRMSARVAEELMRWGGRGGQFYSGYGIMNDVMHGRMPDVGSIAALLLGGAAGRGARALRNRRMSRGTTRQDLDAAHARGERVTMTPNRREPEALTPEEYVAKYGPDSNAFRNAQELKRRLEIDELEKRRDTLNLYGNDVPPPWAQ